VPAVLHRLDVIGSLCPLPILFSVVEMNKLSPGEVLEILGDDPGMLEDIPAWCEQSGHKLLSISQDPNGVIRAQVERGGWKRRKAPSNAIPTPAGLPQPVLPKGAPRK
jgi:tRNA 2-thiouridine synthesizing protein A